MIFLIKICFSEETDNQILFIIDKMEIVFIDFAIIIDARAMPWLISIMLIY